MQNCVLKNFTSILQICFYFKFQSMLDKLMNFELDSDCC